ncbi:hypothetical protein ACFOWM_04250 [Ferruginibacter yonginensis]|uniref:Uncharacterized protein n=1 Tax=Ferruginibacter yonginensis TaxID=1310416 RepID=A0ABV8QP92_9BACT
MLIEIEEILNILSKVTPGPWKSFVEGRDHISGSNFIQTGEKNYDIEFINLSAIDQDFIAMARNVLPSLIDELIKLKAK